MGITNLTSSLPSEHCLCEESEPPEYSEAYFSNQPCECCGSSLAGDREHATGYNPEHKTVLCYEVCQDCLYVVGGKGFCSKGCGEYFFHGEGDEDLTEDD